MNEIPLTSLFFSRGLIHHLASRGSGSEQLQPPLLGSARLGSAARWTRPALFEMHLNVTRAGCSPACALSPVDAAVVNHLNLLQLKLLFIGRNDLLHINECTIPREHGMGKTSSGWATC